MTLPEDRAAPLVVFDGACLLCNTGMQFIVVRDPREHFRFATLQSELGQALSQRAGVVGDGRDATMLLVDGGAVYVRSEAVLRVARELGRSTFERGLFRVVSRLGALVPRRLRDFAYEKVARHRHRWPWAPETCWLPNDDVRRRIPFSLTGPSAAI